MKNIILLITTFILCQPCMAQWKTNGPFGGYIETLNTNGSIIYAGTYANCLFLSHDGGTTWKQDSGLFKYIGGDVELRSIVVSGNTVYACVVGPGGMYISSDGGNTWAPCNDIGSYAVYNVCLSGNYIFAATNHGVYRSNNNGATFTPVNNGLGVDATLVKSFVICGAYIFAGAENGIYYSTDNGNTWQVSLSGTGANVLAVKDSIVYAGTNNNVYTSSNKGVSWVPSGNVFNNFYKVNALKVDGKNIYAGDDGSGFYYSTDSGATWKQRIYGLVNLSVTSITTIGNKIYIGTHGNGVYVSTDTGRHWTTTNTGIFNTQITTLCKNGPYVFAGTYSTLLDGWGGIFFSPDNGATWTEADSGLTVFNLNIEDITLMGGKLYTLTNKGLFSSADNGKHWSLVSKPSFGKLVAGGPYLYGWNYLGISRSDDNGATWKIKNSGLIDSSSIGSIDAVDSFVYVRTWKGIYVSSNYGENWKKKISGLRDSIITAIGIGTSAIFIGTAHGVYTSDFHGNAWTSYGDSSQNKYAQRLFAITGDSVYLANDVEILLSVNGGNWQVLVKNDIKYERAYSMLFANHTLFIGTRDNSVWQLVQGDIATALENRGPEVASFTVYPNPATNSFTVNSTADERQLLEVFDITGKQVLTRVISEKVSTINTEQLANGIYEVRLSGANGQENCQLLISR